jgi:proteic killer suppression protein
VRTRKTSFARCATRYGLLCGTGDPGFPAQGAAPVFETGSTAGIQAPLARKLRLQPAALHSATQIDDMDLPGYSLHPLKGADKGKWSIWVNGNWRLTFAFRDGHVFDLDIEDYH